MIDKLGAAVFVLMIALLAFVAGALVMLSGVFPHDFLRDAYRAAESLYIQQQIINNPVEANLYQPARSQERGVTVHDRDRAMPGYTLYTSGDDAVARLVDMDGRLVHEWRRPFSEVWNEEAAVQSPQPDPLVYMDRAKVFPNGDLLVIYISSADTPWGYGLAKLDKDSAVLWSYLAHVHHDVDIAPDGRLLALTHELRFERPATAEQFDRPYVEDFVAVLSPEGEELEKISLTQALLRSRYGLLFKLLPYFSIADPTHTNAVHYIDADKARVFPFGEEGDVLLSFRDISLIAVLSMETREIVWGARGPWLRQHDPTILADGEILLFDNFGGLDWTNGSRVLQVDPQTVGVTWSYTGTAEHPFHSAIRSHARRLANGNTLITESDGGRLFEVTPSGDIVWEYVNPLRAGEGDGLIPIVNGGQRIDPAYFNDAFRRELEQRAAAVTD